MALCSCGLACSSRSGSVELSAENKQAFWQEIFIFKFRALVIHINIAAIAA